MSQVKGINLEDIQLDPMFKSTIEQGKLHNKSNDYISKDVKKKVKGHSHIAERCCKYILEKLVEVDDGAWSVRTGDETVTRISGSVLDAYLLKLYRMFHVQMLGKEVDILVVLHKYKLILQIEIKHREGLQTCMKSALPQFVSMREWLCRQHGGILKDWMYAAVGCFTKVAESEFASYTPNFYISKDMYESADGISSWWKRFSDNLPEKSHEADESYKSYQEFLRLTAGLGKLGTDWRKSSTEWTKAIHGQIHGEDAPAVVPGVYAGNVYSKSVPHALTTNIGREVAEEHRQVASVIMWSDEQEALLTTSPNNLLFTSDYGTGEHHPI